MLPLLAAPVRTRVPDHPSLSPLWPSSGRPEPKPGQSGRGKLTGPTALPQSLDLPLEHNLLPRSNRKPS